MTSAVKDQQRLEAFSKVLNDFERMVVPVMEEVSTRLVCYIIMDSCIARYSVSALNTTSLVWSISNEENTGLVHNLDLVEPAIKLLVYLLFFFI